MAEAFSTSSNIDELRRILAKEKDELRELKKRSIDKMLKGEIAQNDVEAREKISTQVRHRFNRIMKMQKKINELEQAQILSDVVERPDEER